MSEHSQTKPDAPPPSQGRIGKYDIVRPLGAGAMGMVYLATDPLLERDVALKVMVPQIASDPEQKHRFEREAKAVARMTHPNVVTVYDFGYHTDGSPYIAMELLKGQDLLQLLRQGEPMSLERKLSIIIQVLEGLAHAHQAGIVHRDIKPANIFVKDDGTVKIMDFGVARLSAGSMTGTGTIVGTADYMSPEQIKGQKVDGRSDLFSAGCMLYELLSGQRPFHADNIMAIFYRITHEDPDFAPVAADEAGARLLPILHRALAKEDAERYQSAQEFAAALRFFQKGAPAAVERGPLEDILEAQPTPAPGAPAATSAPPAPLAEAKPEPSPPKPQAPARPAPTARTQRGSAPAALPGRLRDIYVGRKSGLLHFTHGLERRSVRFRKGHIVYAYSSVPSERMGEMLVRQGLLSQADFDRATDVVVRDQKRLGTALVELGIMDRGRLEDALAAQVSEILAVVFGRSDGTFAFEELAEDTPLPGDVVLKLSTGEMILEAARSVGDPEAVRQALGSTDRILALSTDPLLRFQKIALTPGDGYVLSRIDGTVTAREVIQVVPLPAEDVERSLFGLLCTGVVGYTDVPRTRSHTIPGMRRQADAPSTTSGPTRPSMPPPVAAPPPSVSPLQAGQAAKPVSEAEARQASEVRRREILEAYEGLKTRNHFEVLGIPRASSETQVKEAYFRLAKKFHPDVQHDPALADLRDTLEAVFIRLGEAYETLRDAEKRTRYEEGLPRGPRAAEARPAASSFSPPGASPPPPPSAPPPAAAYPAAPPFDAGSEAAGAPRKAAESLRAAEKLMEQEKYWDAIQLLEQALPWIEGKQLQKTRVLLARCYQKNPKWVKQAEGVLLKVVQEDPRNAEAYFVLGTIYKGGGLKNRAVTMFRKALEEDPQHGAAATELASLGPEGDEPGTRALKKLFRKT